MSKQCGVYCIKNIITNKYYVGSSVDIETRFKNHKSLLRAGNHHSIKLQNSWNKHGESAFQFEILLTCSASTRTEHEQRFINILETATKGYNMNPLVEGIVAHSDETKAKISAALTGVPKPPKTKEHSENQSRAQTGRKMSEETKRKIAEANKGKKKGPLSEEHKEKLRQANLGRKFTDEERAAVSAGRTGIPMSDETKAKLSAAKTGVAVGPHSEETKKKISESNKGKHTITPEHREKMRLAQNAKYQERVAMNVSPKSNEL